MKMDDMKFRNELPKGDTHFQSEIKCTTEELEKMLGYKMTDVSSESDYFDLVFEGAAIWQGRVMPLIIHNWKPNRRDNPPMYAWHIRTTFYQDGQILKSWFETMLKSKE